MEILSVKTKKQIVLSRIIYDYVVTGLAKSLDSLSDDDKQVFIMRVNLQAISYAIDISKQDRIEDIDYNFNQLGVAFNISVPLSQIEFSPELLDEHINTMRSELGEDFESMVTYLKKMEQTVV